MYRQTTRSIEVIVEPFFLDDQSQPDINQFVWAYQVRIVNHGSEVVQLLSRHWRISERSGQSREISGAGVVGEQPVLNPGETFEYHSFTQLKSESGIMAGSYHVKNNRGEKFAIAIPPFSLDTPWTRFVYN